MVGTPLGITSSGGTSVPLIHYPIFGTVWLSKSVLTFGRPYTEDVVLVQRGQQMSIQRVVSNVGVFRTWVNVLTMSLRSLFKPKPFVQFFGLPCREHKLFFGLRIFIDVTSHPCLEMKTGVLTVQPTTYQCYQPCFAPFLTDWLDSPGHPGPCLYYTRTSRGAATHTTPPSYFGRRKYSLPCSEAYV